MSTFKNEDLLKINSGLVYLSQENTDAWMKVGRNIKKIKPHLISFQESHTEIIEKYASRGDDGEIIKGNDGQIEFNGKADEADKAWDQLNKEEVDVSFIKISSNEITKDGKQTSLNAINLEPLLDIVITDGEE